MVPTSKTAATFLPLAIFLTVIVPVSGQRSFSGAAEIEQSLHKLNELGTVLMIAAHPDDERTAVLAYFARGRHMRTAYLSLTRGEGGQNLIGPEQGAQLGIIRTQELLAARRIDGAEQYFTRAIDFGFSKIADELADLIDVFLRQAPPRSVHAQPRLFFSEQRANSRKRQSQIAQSFALFGIHDVDLSRSQVYQMGR